MIRGLRAGKSRRTSPGASRWSPCWSAGPGCPGSEALPALAAGWAQASCSDRRWREELRAGRNWRGSPKLSGRGDDPDAPVRDGSMRGGSARCSRGARRRHRKGLRRESGAGCPSAAAAAGAGGRACDRRCWSEPMAIRAHRICRQCRRQRSAATLKGPGGWKPAPQSGAVVVDKARPSPIHLKSRDQQVVVIAPASG